MQGTYLVHHGIKGQRWGIRRYQNEDGTLTPAGKERYYGDSEYLKKELDSRIKKVDEQVFKDLSETSKSFNDQANALSEDYANLYKDLEKNKDFHNDVYASIKELDGTISSLSSKEDLERALEYYSYEVVDDSIKKYLPNSFKEKEKKMWETGDKYFDDVRSMTDSLISDLDKDRELKDSIAITYGDNKKLGEQAYYYLTKNDKLRFDTQWNSYVFRHFDDYWVNDIDEYYNLQNSFTADELRQWLKKEGN